jgi:hypothetical protein
MLQIESVVHLNQSGYICFDPQNMSDYYHLYPTIHISNDVWRQICCIFDTSSQQYGASIKLDFATIKSIPEFRPVPPKRQFICPSLYHGSVLVITGILPIGQVPWQTTVRVPLAVLVRSKTVHTHEYHLRSCQSQLAGLGVARSGQHRSCVLAPPSPEHHCSAVAPLIPTGQFLDPHSLEVRIEYTNRGYIRGFTWPYAFSGGSGDPIVKFACRTNTILICEYS